MNAMTQKLGMVRCSAGGGIGEYSRVPVDVTVDGRNSHAVGEQ